MNEGTGSLCSQWAGRTKRYFTKRTHVFYVLINFSILSPPKRARERDRKRERQRETQRERQTDACGPRTVVPPLLSVVIKAI